MIVMAVSSKHEPSFQRMIERHRMQVTANSDHMQTPKASRAGPHAFFFSNYGAKRYVHPRSRS